MLRFISSSSSFGLFRSFFSLFLVSHTCMIDQTQSLQAMTIRNVHISKSLHRIKTKKYFNIINRHTSRMWGYIAFVWLIAGTRNVVMKNVCTHYTLKRQAIVYFFAKNCIASMRIITLQCVYVVMYCLTYIIACFYIPLRHKSFLIVFCKYLIIMQVFNVK